MRIKNVLYVALVTAVLLLVPLIGNWPWTGSDFVVAGVLIFGVGLILTAILSRATVRRWYAAALVIFLFLWLWAELAVGVFTDWGS